MIFNTGAALLDTIVLSVISKEPEGTYGYKITQDVRMALDVSESTLYPVLRRLLKDNCLETYDQEYMGRNRRYYHLSAKGKLKHLDNIKEWTHFSQNVDSLLRKGELK